MHLVVVQHWPMMTLQCIEEFWGVGGDKISENGCLNLVVVQEDVDDLQRQHLADLLLGHTRLLQ